MSALLHIYAFGSLCRGEVLPGSDVDLLAVVTGARNKLSRSMFSIYSHDKIEFIWKQGNPFAWHLHLESALIFSGDKRDYLAALGAPSPYTMVRQDCERFLNIFKDAFSSARTDHTSIVFDLSAAFLGLRNFSTCFLLAQGVL
jgi:Nucleotidyltransferase domain